MVTVIKDLIVQVLKNTPALSSEGHTPLHVSHRRYPRRKIMFKGSAGD